MIRLKDYIIENDNLGGGNTDLSDNKDDINKLKAKIKFTIWESPDKKVTQLKDNESYQKIEYEYNDTDKKIKIDFLLGYISSEDTWKLWIGKPGSINYDDDPYTSLKTSDFGDAIMKSLDKISEFINKVNDDQLNYIQYYINK